MTATPLYFAAGLLAGWVFWIKEEVIVFGLVFVFFAAFQLRWRTGWLWFRLGGFLFCIADLIFFWLAYGDPLYHYDVVHRAVGDRLATQTLGETCESQPTEEADAVDLDEQKAEISPRRCDLLARMLPLAVACYRSVVICGTKVTSGWRG
jgi:hypothetical protein